jgi:uncharacterized alpha-E superfamily protein
MLSRTADHLYWMARYIERAENVARVLDVTYNMDLLPSETSNELDLWTDALLISGSEKLFEDKYGAVTAENVIRHLTMDVDNPSSIYSALRSARANAGSVRVAMTSETWEHINALWLEISQYSKGDLTKSGLNEFCEWVRSRSHLFRGVCFGTMMRDESFNFVRLGTFVERADNTARLLLAKYDALLSLQQKQNGTVDHYEWSALLRSASAFQAYHKIYSNAIEPEKVAELLVFRHDMPRSLHACYDELMPIIEQLAALRQSEAIRLSGELHSKLHYGRMDDISKSGVPKFLLAFISENAKLGNEIHKSFFSAIH